MRSLAGRGSSAVHVTFELAERVLILAFKVRALRLRCASTDLIGTFPVWPGLGTSVPVVAHRDSITHYFTRCSSPLSRVWVHLVLFSSSPSQFLGSYTQSNSDCCYIAHCKSPYCTTYCLYNGRFRLTFCFKT